MPSVPADPPAHAFRQALLRRLRDGQPLDVEAVDLSLGDAAQPWLDALAAGAPPADALAPLFLLAEAFDEAVRALAGPMPPWDAKNLREAGDLAGADAAAAWKGLPQRAHALLLPPLAERLLAEPADADGRRRRLAWLAGVSEGLLRGATERRAP